MTSQKNKVLDYMKLHGAASARDIFEYCYCNSPRKLISDLRRDGYKIEDRWRTKDGKRWKEYYLRKETA